MTETLQKRPEAEAPEASTEPGSGPETELVECVVLTGPRRGEIVAVNLERQEETWTEEEMDILVDALRKLDQALVGLLDETRGLHEDIEAMRRDWQ